ncbi:hypothetical protein [Phenylobacterium sp.]|uniref:hypothetical protein n=1 Tax=Phenylobacterium sp. TaxID=1871053 RepID=UPI002737A9A6|nr:hypothetical protein [Phenylobacterium sp.]MDP3869921.1 hypothetical protein [Phenylobacterium sp.]
MLSLRQALLAFSLTISLLFSGCATKTPPAVALTVPITDTLRAKCPRPPPPVLPETLPDDAAALIDKVLRPVLSFSVRQEAAIGICEGRKDGAVSLIDAHNRTATALAQPSSRK